MTSTCRTVVLITGEGSRRVSVRELAKLLRRGMTVTSGKAAQQIDESKDAEAELALIRKGVKVVALLEGRE